jgi:hypothetical protein
MEKYKVKKSDLIGNIKDFPIEIVQKMVDYQYEQTGKYNISVFQKCCTSDRYAGGFTWGATTEGYQFWCKVVGGEFKVFFEKYPKTMKKKSINLVYIVGTARTDDAIIKTLKKYGGKDKNKVSGQSNHNVIYFITPKNEIDAVRTELKSLLDLAGYEEIQVEESIEEFTIEEIAKLLGKDPNLIRIKK